MRHQVFVSEGAIGVHGTYHEPSLELLHAGWMAREQVRLPR